MSGRKRKGQENTEGAGVPADGAPVLLRTPLGLALTGNGQTIVPDLSRMLPRLKTANLREALLVRAARVKNPGPLRALDATAGMGEDALLLAAAGFRVDLYEKDPVIAALLQDALLRAAEDDSLRDAVSRMTLHEGDSIAAMKALPPAYDVVYLDPMFPGREKSALVKTKFQLIHGLEKPCEDEEELLLTAMALRPAKLIVKRPLKGAFLAGRKPDYSLKGKAIRYDVFVFAREQNDAPLEEPYEAE